MLGREVANSRKLSELTERQACIYLILLPQHDGEGIIEVDDISMLVGCGRFAVEHGWSAADMAEAREAFASGHLWRLFRQGDRELAEWLGWAKFQRLDKMGRGSDLAGIYGGTMAELRHNSGLEGKGREEEGKRRGREGEANGDAPATAFFDEEAESRRIAATWRLLHDELGKPAFINGRDRVEQESSAKSGTCLPWPGDALLEEFRRTVAGLSKRKLDTTLRMVLCHLGESWDDRAPRRPADQEQSEAGKRRTRALIDGMTDGFPADVVAAAKSRRTKETP